MPPKKISRRSPIIRVIHSIPVVPPKLANFMHPLDWWSYGCTLFISNLNQTKRPVRLHRIGPNQMPSVWSLVWKIFVFDPPSDPKSSGPRTYYFLKNKTQFVICFLGFIAWPLCHFPSLQAQIFYNSSIHFPSPILNLHSFLEYSVVYSLSRSWIASHFLTFQSLDSDFHRCSLSPHPPLPYFSFFRFSDISFVGIN